MVEHGTSGGVSVETVLACPDGESDGGKGRKGSDSDAFSPEMQVSPSMLIGPPPLQTGRCPLAGAGEAREGGRRRPRCQLTLRNRPGRGPATGPGLPESRVTCCAGPRGGGNRTA